MKKEFNGEAFIKKIVRLYHGSRHTVIENNRIKRGRSRAISGLAEEEFANEVIKMLPRGYSILIDQPIRINNKSFYPDIIILKGNKIKQIWELKMDLGFLRDDFIRYCKRYFKNERTLNSVGKCTKLEQKVLKSFSCRFTKKYIIVISKENIGVKKLMIIESKLKDEINKTVFFLSHTIHPNNSEFETIDQVVKEIKLDKKAFGRISAILRQNR